MPIVLLLVHIPEGAIRPTKLKISLGWIWVVRVYIKRQPLELDFVSYPAGWRIPEFTKINGDDTRTTWEHISQYILQLGEASFNDALRVCLFSLSLT